MRISLVLFTVSCAIAAIYFTLAVESRQEFVGIDEAVYNSETGTIDLRVSHSVGCGTYYDYGSRVVKVDRVRKSVVLQVFVETDNVCEGGIVGQPISIEMPLVPFEPQQIIFESRGKERNLFLEIPQNEGER